MQFFFGLFWVNFFGSSATSREALIFLVGFLSVIGGVRLSRQSMNWGNVDFEDAIRDQRAICIFCG